MRAGWRRHYEKLFRNEFSSRILQEMKKLLGFLAYFFPPPLNKVLHQLRGVNFRDPKTTWIGVNVHIDNKFPDLVSIGEQVTIAFGAKIFAHMDPPQSMAKRYLPAYTREVRIGNNVFIGAGALILPGVTIGDWVIVAAGAVVNKSLPDFAVAAGNPAKIIGDLRQKNSTGT